MLCYVLINNREIRFKKKTGSGFLTEKVYSELATSLMKLNFQRAASVIKNAKALVVTAGAGMGVDSGLPDFRGPEGFWKAYPPIKERGLTLPEMVKFIFHFLLHTF